MDYAKYNFSGEGYNAEKYYYLTNYELHKTCLNGSVILESLKSYQSAINKLDVENQYSEPMKTIGLYIAAASLICTVLMGFDLVHGLRRSKPWFPCNFFSINAASLAVIAVAMKLPVDLSCPMPGVVDQMAKLGSMAFMCTMMANLLPSLASMDSKELLTNIVGLGVLVITLVVNLCIQITTGVIESYKRDPSQPYSQEIDSSATPVAYSSLAIIYVTMLLMLLIIHVCSCLAILKSKQIIESKYQQQQHETAPKDVQQSTQKFVSLGQHVKKYWIMAGSGSPQFIMACSATTTASGLICALTSLLHILTIGLTLSDGDDKYDSDYKWSMLVILIVQLVGVVVGSIAPVSRCFASSSFKVSWPSFRKHLMVFKVESYWTQKLSDWKHDSKQFPFYCRKRNIALKIMKILILEFSIKLQQVVVVICQIIALIMYVVVICLFGFFRCLKWLLLQAVCSSGKSTENLEDNYKYVLHLDEKIELAESILKRLLKSHDKVIQKGKKKQPNNLLNLIKEKSTTGFQGVIRFDNEDRDYWSLAVINLTTIAVTLRKIKKVDSLLKSVREGLEYVTLVEQNLNVTDVFIRKATEKLWEEVDFRHKWLGIKLNKINFEVNAANGEENDTMQIVKHFQKLSGAGSTDGVGTDDDSKFKSLCMKSMSRITTAIIDDHKESNKESFDELISSRIADTIAACLTNLPKVIAMKCHTDVIEKREKSVKAAAKLLGKTEEIIKFLEDPSRQVPSTNHDDVLT